MEQEIRDFLQNGAQFSLNKAIGQNWRVQSFSYLQTPRPDFGLMLLCKGRLQFKSEHGVLDAVAGDVIFLPKGCFYWTSIRIDLSSVSNYLVNFDTVFGDTIPNAPTKLFSDATPACKEQFRTLVAESRTKGPSSLRAQGQFCLLLDAVLQNGAQGESQDLRTLNQARALLDGGEALSVPEVARRCCISESSLRRIFQKELGLSPAAYRTQTKLHEAEYLLESTDLSVSQIADKLGFFDAAYFCKLFRASTGQTPKSYQKNRQL